MKREPKGILGAALVPRIFWEDRIRKLEYSCNTTESRQVVASYQFFNSK